MPLTEDPISQQSSRTFQMTDNRTAWRTVRLISDAPLENLEKEVDAARCLPLAEQLKRQLLDFLKPENNNAKAPRIGVLGGLGQGKTSTIQKALNAVEEELKNEGYFQKPWLHCNRVEWFDTAHYKNDDLEYELDRLLGGLGPLTASSQFWILAAYAIPLTVFCFLVWGVLLIIGMEPKILGVLVTSVSGGMLGALMPFRYWWRSGQRKQTLGSKEWRQQGIRLISRTTQILIIDNLDRATIGQQRAVLRALYKHRDEMGYAVVIGFDETHLLASTHEPESPGELLRKAINVEARMPVRVITDSVRLAWMAAKQAADLNPHFQSMFSDSLALAALARILDLLAEVQPVSPRAAKYLTNNALLFLALVNASDKPNVQDWRAVLRLLALYTVLPELRQQGDVVRLVLQLNRYDGLDALLSLLPAVDKDRGALAKRIFNATRAFFPASQDWSPWVVVWQARSFAEQVDDANTRQQDYSNDWLLPDFDVVNSLYDGLSRLVQGWPCTELANLSVLLSASFPQAIKSEEMPCITNDATNALLPLLDVMLLRLEQQTEREYLLTSLWTAAETGQLPWALPIIGEGRFYGFLAERLLLEPAPKAVLSQQAFTRFWLRLSILPISKRLRLLTLLPSSLFHLADILALVALSENTGQDDLGPETWVAAFGSSDTEDNSCPFIERLLFPDNPVQCYLEQNRSANVMISRFWPPLLIKADNFPDILLEHCTAWRRLKMKGSSPSTPLEYLLLDDEALLLWLQNKRPENLLMEFAALFGGKADVGWSADAWLTMLEPYLYQPKESPLRRMRQLRKRLYPLWASPSSKQSILEIQIILAATFLSKQALNKLAQNLSGPLSDRASDVVFASVRYWTKLYASYSRQSDTEGVFSRAKPIGITAEFWFAGLRRETWDKLCEGKLPSEWGDLHRDRWQR